MTLEYVEGYRDADIARRLAERICGTSRKKIRIMEVCGTHTVSIFRSGIRSLLPETISLLSGPGCPVCVTAQGEIDAFIALAREKDVIVATFGDLIRVPGSGSSLQRERAAGADVRIVYSAVDALKLARENPQKKVVFLGVGFETTAPTIAATIASARQMKVKNFSVMPANKIVPPALMALMADRTPKIDGFILPGHVAVIIGMDAFEPFFKTYRIPCAAAGFEPIDLLQAILSLVKQIETKRPRLENAYPRVVTTAGNPKARKIMETIFEIKDAKWRGLGTIKASGLYIREAYADFDALRLFKPDLPDVKEIAGCACGEILTGAKIPPQCPLYKKLCTPMNPTGPCMVSSEGTCAAYYRYHSE